jgi:small subunit ribosomal protein S2
MTEEDLLVPQETYLKSGIHIGTKFKTKYMSKFIYKTRPDGLSVLNLHQIDERIRLAVKFLSNYGPEDLILFSRRENGWKPLKAFHKATGTRVIIGRYPPGTLTNTGLDTFTEAKCVLITDAWPDRNAIKDALKGGIPVVALCDTNNQANDVDLVVPCNNKGKKALGLFFFILAREYMKARGLIKSDEEFTLTQEDFTEE